MTLNLTANQCQGRGSTESEDVSVKLCVVWCGCVVVAGVWCVVSEMGCVSFVCGVWCGGV
jgi:hypothetical protein